MRRRVWLRPFAAVALSLSLSVLAGCAGGGSSPGGSSPGGSSPARAPDPGYTVTLESQPSPMQSGRVATVMLRVNQPDGTPLKGASVRFVPEHTSMSMGASPVPAQEREPGVYAAEYTPAMGGTYRVTVQVDGPNGKGEKTLEAQVR